MKKICIIWLFICIIIFVTVIIANAVTLDFEEVPWPYHNNVSTYYQGVTFSSNASIYDADHYDDFHYPSHSGISVLHSSGMNMIDIIFDNPVSDFSLWYTSATSVNNIPDKFELKAYSDNNMINLLGSVVGPYNWGTIDELVLNYDNIMVVKIIGAQGHYTVDDITYSLMSPVPEPSTLLLIGLGIAIVFGVNRKKYNLKIT